MQPDARTAVPLLQSRRECSLPHSIRMAAFVALAILAAYVVVALLVFDFTQPTYHLYQERAVNGREVALGPRTRWRVDDRGFGFTPYSGDGTEWEYRLYAPICALWRHARGYAAPVPEEHTSPWNEASRPTW